MFLPMGTDAPIYHWPKATVGLIVLNVALLFLVPPPSVAQLIEDDGGVIEIVERETPFERFALTLGDGLHPIQWFTHNFLHYGIGHLVGNMIFLWAFGLVVEGKLGMFRFLAAYAAIGTLHGVFTQTILLWSGIHGHAAGASAIIFGLLAICMFWAPANEASFFVMMWLGFRMFIGQWHIRYTWVAMFYIGEQILNMAWSGMRQEPAISELGHLSGALWGSVIAYVMLKKNWVDCEGWDLFTLWGKNRKLSKDWKLREERLDRANRSEKKATRRSVAKVVDDGPSDEERGEAASKKVAKLIDMGDYPSALLAYDKTARVLADWPPGPVLLGWIKAMHSRKAEVDSLPLMRDYCRKHPGTSARVRLKLAQVLIRDRERPGQAMRVLAEIPDGHLPANLDAVRRQLTRQAEAMLEDGVLELEEED